jgi:hypothetical protein
VAAGFGWGRARATEPVFGHCCAGPVGAGDGNRTRVASLEDYFAGGTPIASVSWLMRLILRPLGGIGRSSAELGVVGGSGSVRSAVGADTNGEHGIRPPDQSSFIRRQ